MTMDNFQKLSARSMILTDDLLAAQIQGLPGWILPLKGQQTVLHVEAHSSKKYVLGPNPPVPQNATLLGNRGFADVIS